MARASRTTPTTMRSASPASPMPPTPALSWTYGYDSLDRLNAASQDRHHARLDVRRQRQSTHPDRHDAEHVHELRLEQPRELDRRIAAAHVRLRQRRQHALLCRRDVHVQPPRTGWPRPAMAASPRRTRTTRWGSGSREPPRASPRSMRTTRRGIWRGSTPATGALIQETVWLGDIPVATLRPNGSGGVILYYVHADQLNTPRLVTDTSNNIRWRWESDPFGTSMPNENPAIASACSATTCGSRASSTTPSSGCTTTTSETTIRPQEGTSRAIRSGCAAA